MAGIYEFNFKRYFSFSKYRFIYAIAVLINFRYLNRVPPAVTVFAFDSLVGFVSRKRAYIRIQRSILHNTEIAVIQVIPFKFRCGRFNNAGNLKVDIYGLSPVVLVIQVNNFRFIDASIGCELLVEIFVNLVLHFFRVSFDIGQRIDVDRSDGIEILNERNHRKQDTVNFDFMLTVIVD